MTPMVVWRTHGLPDSAMEAGLLAHLERVAAERCGDEGFGSSTRGAPCTRSNRGEPRPDQVQETLFEPGAAEGD
ncbi:MAG: hypothetical protein M3O77_05185 [Chloroflexota bacterium]|nr:hypothetical protein [Chloroflexota bacterium]